MRRPLCVFCILTAAAVWISVIFFPADPGEKRAYEQAFVTLTAVAESVEFMAGEPGSDGSSCRICLRGIRDGTGNDFTDGGKILCYLADTVSAAGLSDQAGGDGELPAPGDRITVCGRLKPFHTASNEGEFDAEQYYRTLGICCQMTEARILEREPGRGPFAAADRILFRCRRGMARALDASFEKEEAGVMRAVLLGERGMADDELLALYRRGGILHLLVISGLHISLVGTVLFTALKKLRCPSNTAAAAAAAGTGLYGRLAGMSSSIFRAVWMFSLRIAAPCFRRTYDLPTAAATAAALLLCLHPYLALQSGFLYSFSAVFGIAFLAPALPEKLSFAAISAAVLPVQLWFYYGVAPYGIVLTLLFVPFLPVLLLCGAGVCFLFPFSGKAALLPAYPAHLILGFYKFVAGKAELLPGSFLITGRPAPWQICVYYAILFLSLYFRKPALPQRTVTAQDRKRAFKQLLLRFTGILLAVLILVIRPRYGLTVSFLDVGQGDGICIQAQNCAILIDGGSSTRSELGKSVLLPFLKSRGIASLDLAILTHEDYDHCSGLIEILEQSGDPGGIRVERVALPDLAQSCREEKYHAIEQLAEQKQIPVYYYGKGDMLRAGNMKMKCLHPERGAEYAETNAGSGVFFLTYGGFSALFTGDLEGDGEEQVVDLLEENPLHLTVLKAAHHGSAAASGEAFLSCVNPAFAVISCGKNNRYGHPAPETVARLEAAGCRILDTRFHGEISFHADPPTQKENIWYNVYIHHPQKFE